MEEMQRDNTIVYVLGNGFDLAVNLPTRYTDFMCFINNWTHFYKYFVRHQNNSNRPSMYLKCPPDGKLTKDILLEYALEGDLFDKENISRLDDIISNNLWITYLQSCNYQATGWAGFEGEIKAALDAVNQLLRKEKDICTLDMSPHQKAAFQMISVIFPPNQNRFITKGYLLRNNIDEETIGELRKQFLLQAIKALDELCEAFRLYLVEFVEKMSVDRSLGLNILPTDKTFIVSLNYTHNQLEQLGLQPDHVHMVHGSDRKMNNIVLGIDNDSSLGNEFIRFKKFFQRIQKKTGSNYKLFFNAISNNTGLVLPQKVVFFGHSLDPIDKDLIKDIFSLCENGTIYIYYNQQEDYEQKVINLVKIFDAEYVIDAIATERIILTDKKELLY